MAPLQRNVTLSTRPILLIPTDSALCRPFANLAPYLHHLVTLQTHLPVFSSLGVKLQRKGFLLAHGRISRPGTAHDKAALWQNEQLETQGCSMQGLVSLGTDEFSKALGGQVGRLGV